MIILKRTKSKGRIKRKVVKPESSYKKVRTTVNNWEEQFYNSKNRTPREVVKENKQNRKKKVNSKLEEKIARLLTKSNINFEREKEFEDCINYQTGCKLRFDFYLPHHNLLIEYDGQQHFKSVFIQNKRSNFENQKIRDEIKNKYCEQKEIKLIRFNKNNFKDFNLFIENLLRDAE